MQHYYVQLRAATGCQSATKRNEQQFQINTHQPFTSPLSQDANKLAYVHIHSTVTTTTSTSTEHIDQTDDEYCTCCRPFTMTRGWFSVFCSLHVIHTRALQPVATCRQSPYLRPAIITVTSISLRRHSLLSWPRPALRTNVRTYGHITAFNI